MKKNTYLGLAFTSSPLPFLNDAVASQEKVIEKKSETKPIINNTNTSTIEWVLLSFASVMFFYWLAEGLKGLLS
jgi:hypothetical protein